MGPPNRTSYFRGVPIAVGGVKQRSYSTQLLEGATKIRPNGAELKVTDRRTDPNPRFPAVFCRNLRFSVST